MDFESSNWIWDGMYPHLFGGIMFTAALLGLSTSYFGDGTDAYALAKKVGRYKQIKRTEGVSSTDIVGRILSFAKDMKVDSSEQSQLGTRDSGKTNSLQGSQAISGHVFHFLPTSRQIVQFSNGKILNATRQQGDFLLVGIYTDQTVSELRGSHFPLMNVHERSLSVLACCYVNEIIISAPWEVSNDMMKTFNISLVVRGTVAENSSLCNYKPNPYAVPKSMGIFKMLESPTDITRTSVAQRIIANHDVYVKRNTKKEASEKKYYAEKKNVSGD